MMPEGKVNKEELIAAIKTERARLEADLAKFSDVQKAKALLENGWSVKDLMAHIASWERVAFDILQPARDAEPLKEYIAQVFESIDNFNAKTYEQNKDKPLNEIEGEFNNAYQNFFALVESLDEAFIASNLPFEGTEEITIESIISSNTYQHYQEHAETLENYSTESGSD